MDLSNPFMANVPIIPPEDNRKNTSGILGFSESMGCQLSRIDREAPAIWSFLTNPSRIWDCHGFLSDCEKITQKTTFASVPKYISEL